MRVHRLLIPLAAFAAVLPLILQGPSCGHDFDFHLLNWLEAAHQLAHGHYPHWAYTPAYGAGEPRFLFYPPLSWLLGAALTAVLPFAAVPAAYTWLCLTLSGFSLHRLASPYTTPTAATLASIVYLLNPYSLFTAYERTAYGELLAAALIPLLFAAILRPRPTVPGIAIPVALLWLTNAPAAVMSTYALALLALTRLAFTTVQSGAPGLEPETWDGPSTRSTVARTTLLATALGLAMPAFYLLPAAYQRRFVTIDMAVIPGMAPADNFLFHHTGVSEDALAHDAVLHTASVIAVLLLTLTALTLATLWLRRAPALPRYALPCLTALTLTIAVLLTPLSLFLWRQVPELAFLQFPWRTLALLAAVFAFTAALACRGLTLNPPALTLAAAALAALLILPAWSTFRQGCDPADTPTGRRLAYLSPQGTEPTDEYTPLDADADTLKPSDPPFWLAPNADSPPPSQTTPGPAPDHLTLAVPSAGFLILNRRQYPLWLTTINGHPAAPHQPERDDGLLSFALPAGQDTIDLTETTSPDRVAGDVLSGLGLAVLLLAARRRASGKLLQSSSHPS